MVRPRHNNRCTLGALDPVDWNSPGQKVRRRILKLSQAVLRAPSPGGEGWGEGGQSFSPKNHFPQRMFVPFE